MSILSEPLAFQTNGEVLEFSTTNFGTFKEMYDVNGRLDTLVGCLKHLHTFKEEIIRLKIDAIFGSYVPYNVRIYPYAGHTRIEMSRMVKGIKHSVFEIRVRPKTY